MESYVRYLFKVLVPKRKRPSIKRLSRDTHLVRVLFFLGRLICDSLCLRGRVERVETRLTRHHVEMDVGEGSNQSRCREEAFFFFQKIK